MPSIHSTLKEQGNKRINVNERASNSFISHDEQSLLNDPRYPIQIENAF